MAKTMKELYEEVPEEEIDGPNESESSSVPDGYKPLSQKNRMDWNSLVRYVKDKSPDALDDKTGKKGLAYMEEYKKDNPDFSITPEMVPFVQHEMQQLKSNGSIPGIESGDKVKGVVQDYFKDRNLSPVDGVIGPLTATQGYPEISGLPGDQEGKYYGTDYESASNADNISDYADTSTEPNTTTTDDDPAVFGEALKKSDADIRDYAVDYINSPKYAQRLSNFYRYPSYIQNKRQEVVKNIGIRENRSGNPGYDRLNNQVAVGEEIGRLSGSTRDELVSHEISHATNNNEEKAAKLSPQEEEFIFSRNKSITPELKNMFRDSSKEKGLSEYLKKGSTHDVAPSESKSDIDAFRYMLQKRGIYDAKKSDVSKQVLEKAEKDPAIKKSFIYKRLKENFDDKSIIEIMNKIALNDGQDDSDMA